MRAISTAGAGGTGGTGSAGGTGTVGRVAAALFAALALSGCGVGWGDDARICTLRGGVPGVSVLFEPRGGGATAEPVGPAGPAVFRLCVDGRCEERTEASAVVGTSMNLRTPDDVRGEELDVRFSVTSVEGGHVIMRDEAKVRMTESWPNGKECDPEGTWGASLKAAPDTGLVAVAVAVDR